MSPNNAIRTKSTSVLDSIYGSLSRLVVLLSRPILLIAGVVRRIRTGSIVSQHYDEFINIAKYKRCEFYRHTHEHNRPAVASDRQAFRRYVLQGEQQAKLFTLALLLFVLVGIIIIRLGKC